MIEANEMRVVVDVPGGSDELLGVMTRQEALAEARSRELDLVLIAKGEPAIVKIVSYDKYRFAKEKKAKATKQASKGQELKELKLSYKIGDHDFDVRKRNAEKFLAQGNKIKFSIQFKGREIMHSDVGLKVMQRMAEEIEESGVVDSPAKVMGRQMIMTVNPKVMPGKSNAQPKKEKKPYTGPTTSAPVVEEAVEEASEAVVEEASEPVQA